MKSRQQDKEEAIANNLSLTRIAIEEEIDGKNHVTRPNSPNHIRDDGLLPAPRTEGDAEPIEQTAEWEAGEVEETFPSRL